MTHPWLMVLRTQPGVGLGEGISQINSAAKATTIAHSFTTRE